ncbi:acyltransferase 3 [Mycena pura]|uniref:Acyltransferase 3 n=1 Tax=Mycena pura TaxID=153505 RepID=A0AAD6YRR9_9AGAR|nr:acyltransferase 3 [Mycena pura]
MSGDPEGELAALLPRLIRDSRVHSLDNLRSALIALVIFHHAALPFGGIGFWPYMSPYHGTNSSVVVLILFVLLNQSYFMGTLFFIAGHFSAWAASNRTWRKFCADKFKRLGIPAVVYTLFVQPLNIVLVQSAKHSPILPVLRTYYANLNGVRGPVWFIAVLLLFDLVYIVVRTCLPPLSFLVPSSATQYRATAVVGIACVIVCSFLIRISHPIGHESPPFQLQLAYASQYVFAYAAGTSLSKIQQYLLVSHPAGRLALTYLLAIFSISLVGTVAHMTHNESLFVGGANPFAFFLAAWNEICFYFIGTALYSLFHDSEHSTRRWGNTARYSYGAFLLHAPVVVALQILVDGAMRTVHGVVKTLVVGVLGVCISWAGAWLLIRIPGVAKVV